MKSLEFQRVSEKNAALWSACMLLRCLWTFQVLKLRLKTGECLTRQQRPGIWSFLSRSICVISTIYCRQQHRKHFKERVRHWHSEQCHLKATWQHLHLNPGIRSKPLVNYNDFVFSILPFCCFISAWADGPFWWIPLPWVLCTSTECALTLRRCH